MKNKIFFLKIAPLIFFISFTIFFLINAAPPLTPYLPGETLNPNCAPGDPNCSVYPPAISTRQIQTTLPLTGGGDLSQDRTLSLIGLSGLGQPNQILSINSQATALEYKNITSLLSAGSGISISGTATATISNTGVLSLNSLTGNINLQGTTNQINVATSSGTITLSLPQDLHPGASPTFANLTISGTAATTQLFVTSSSNLGTVISGSWQGNTISTQYGGTGQDWSAIAQGNIPYFSATGVMATLAPGTANQILITGGAGANPSWSNIASLLTAGSGISISGTNNATITNTGVLSLNSATGALTLQGTTNQVNVSTVGSTITLSTPQDIATSSSPTFAGLTLSNLTSGSVLFAGAGGVISQDNANLFWDNTNKRLGIGTTTPAYKLDVSGDLRVSGQTIFGGVAYTWPSSAGSSGQVLTTDGTGILSWSTITTGVSGSGTQNYLPKWTATTTLGNSIITDDGSLVTISGQLQTTGTTTLATTQGNVGIGTTNPQAKLHVEGEIIGKLKQLIKDFVVETGENVTAGDVVSFINGKVKKGINDRLFNAANTDSISAAALSSTSFVVAYRDIGNSYYGTAIIGTVSGTTITFGSEYVFNAANTDYISAAALSSTSFVVAYRDIGNSSYSTAIIGTVSGTTITFGSEYVFNPASTYYISAAALSSTSFVVAYRDIGNSGTAIIGTVSGTTITFGSPYVFNPASTSYISAAALSSTSFVVAYSDIGNSYYGTAIIGNVSGTTITFGSEYVFNAAGTDSISAAALSSTSFVVAYRDIGNSSYGTAIIGNVSGTTITFGSEYVFNAANTDSISAAALSSTSFVVAYRDIGNSYYGTAIKGNVSGTTIGFAYNFIGIAKNSASEGQQVSVIIEGVSDGHSGLTPGVIYYANPDGSLTTSTTRYRVGLAISSTEILLDSNRDNLKQFFGDLIFANNFLITESFGFPMELIFKNQLGKEILTINEYGDLIIPGSIISSGVITEKITLKDEILPKEGETMEEGELVCLNEEGKYNKCQTPYDEKIFGVLSLDNLKENAFKPIVFGKTQIKVSTKNGEIKPGDYLTSSDIPGVAMKATEPGRVIGIALEKFDGNSIETNGSSSSTIGKIVVFVNPHWSISSLTGDGNSTTSDLTTNNQQLTILDRFTLAIKKSLEKLGLFIENGIAKLKEIIVEKLTAEIIVTKEIKTEKITTNEIQLVDKATGETYCVRIENGEWVKVKGECESLTSQPPTNNTQPTPTPTE
jgi:hypothetical protein